MITVTTGGSHPDDLRRIIDTLPGWFGMAESNAQYVANAATQRNVVARDGDEVVGICLLKHHNPQSIEIDFLGVLRDRHRRGIGRAIIEHVERELRSEGVALLHLKTHGPSVPDEGYEKTRAFYESCGFLAMEERTDIWDERNPCLFLVKPLV